MRKLEARWDAKWQLVWIRDDPYHADAGDAYFDPETGEILWVLDGGIAGEDVRQEALTELKRTPERYEEIRPLHHTEHHKIFREYLATVPEEVLCVCNTASIGGFRETLYENFPDLADEQWYGWHDFHDLALKKLAEEWLRERGYEPEWK